MGCGDVLYGTVVLGALRHRVLSEHYGVGPYGSECNNAGKLSALMPEPIEVIDNQLKFIPFFEVVEPTELLTCNCRRLTDPNYHDRTETTHDLKSRSKLPPLTTQKRSLFSFGSLTHTDALRTRGTQRRKKSSFETYISLFPLKPVDLRDRASFSESDPTTYCLHLLLRPPNLLHQKPKPTTDAFSHRLLCTARLNRALASLQSSHKLPTPAPAVNRLSRRRLPPA
ncbi:hypothetical protein MA16_Dca011576 [Dendrobium catenatum]|uniref:Uncharacterized protein n=1 Tax=Dendrobium catenatum TaxID=906689 RepID=A0A2I0WQN2_9ASPA|nr:hypothetical protein MA16_Dca011576 [Dendrobium catenatum]